MGSLGRIRPGSDRGKIGLAEPYEFCRQNQPASFRSAGDAAKARDNHFNSEKEAGTGIDPPVLFF